MPMKHEWTSFLGCMPRCAYCGVRRIDSVSLYCKQSDVKVKWEEVHALLKEQDEREKEQN